MRKSAVGLGAILVMGLFVGALAVAEGARAQSYPPPVGSLKVEAGTTAPGTSSNVTATVLDNAGNPVQGATVTFRITSQPGSDAHWANGKLETTATINAKGVAAAVLTAGTTAGNIIVETVSGEKTSQVVVAVQEGLPSTGGTPPQGSESGLPTWQIAFLAIAAAALAGGLAIMARRSRRT